ncbi:MAG: tetratricopeptide repeat protein [Hyphomicrobiales bacterium]
MTHAANAGPIRSVAMALVVASLALAAPAARAVDTTALTVAADSLYRLQDWKGAADAYGKIVKADANDGRAWFRLGVSRQSSGDYAAAIDAYGKAEAIGHNPIVQYNLAGACAHEKRDDLAFSWLTKAVDGGFAQVQAYRDDPDLKRLHDDPRFRALEEGMRRNGKPCAYRDEARQLDFWLGDWVCRTVGGVVAGHNSITRADEDCMLLEHWADTRGGSGMSVNLYNPTTKKWQQTWMGSEGQVAEFSGTFHDGAMRLEGYRQGPNGAQVPARLTLTPMGADSVRQLGENSLDGGKTWTTQYELIYTRK